MIRTIRFLMVLYVVILMGCFDLSKNDPKLELTNEEIVHAMVEMYSINAAIQINDETFKDSTNQVYIAQLEKITGKKIATIRSDFEKLSQMPDSLLVLQNIAMDTLRMLQDRINTKSQYNFSDSLQ
ncbi:MAG: hypothetical protein WAU01_09805 [Saprospiraceae bacterium]